MSKSTKQVQRSLVYARMDAAADKIIKAIRDGNTTSLEIVKATKLQLRRVRRIAKQLALAGLIQMEKENNAAGWSYAITGRAKKAKK